MGRTIFVREDREQTGSGFGSGGGYGGGGSSSSTSGSVYVWNLSYETTWQELKDLMKTIGPVDQATILTGGPDGGSTGAGIVSFSRSSDAQRAIRELQETELSGRNIRIREERSGGGGSGSSSGGGRGGFRGRGGRGGRGGFGRSHGGSGGGGSFGSGAATGTQLYVGNLSFDTSWQDLKDHFSSAGSVERADVMKSDSGRSRGFGIVRFSTKEDAESAIQSMNGVELAGRPLEVRLDNKA